MIGKCAFALTTAFAILWFAPPANAAPVDGTWSMIAVTTDGHCGQIEIGLAIDRGRISSTSGKFVFRRIQIAGLVSSSGQAKLTGVAGPREAQGAGRFFGSRATGSWSGTGPSGVCSGFRNAPRG